MSAATIASPSFISASQPGKTPELKETFRQFVGESVFSQLISSMRSTVGEPAYFHGGTAERTFQAQLDQQLAQELAKSSADKFADPMFNLFMLQRG